MVHWGMGNQPASKVHSLALLKVSEVLGPTRARKLLHMFLAGGDRTGLTSPADLEAYGSHLEQGSEIVQTVGAALRRYAALLATVRP